MRIKLRMHLFLISLLISHSCSVKTTNQPEKTMGRSRTIVSGDTVKELGKNIMVVYQDNKNVYWFGSWETGLYRYDGNTMLNYTTKHGLPHNRIDEIKEGISGDIYLNCCSPSSAITKFDGQTFTTITAKTSNNWELKPNDLWFKHPNETGQVYRFDGSILHELQIPKNPKFANPFEIYSIYKDKTDNIWFGSNPVGVCRYNGKRFDWISENDVTELHSGPANGVRSVVQDKNGDFWFNSEFRYTVYDILAPNGKAFYERQKSIGSLDGKQNGNLNEYLSSVRDNDDNLWFATYRDGVWKYDGTKIVRYIVQLNSKDITIFSIYKDNRGGLWLGTHENGAFKFNGQRFEQFKP